MARDKGFNLLQYLFRSLKIFDNSIGSRILSAEVSYAKTLDLFAVWMFADVKRWVHRCTAKAPSKGQFL